MDAKIQQTIETTKPILDRPPAVDEQLGFRTRFLAQSQKEVADFFGVSLDTIKNWAKQGMPGKPSQYPLDLIAQWLRTEGPGSRRAKLSEEELLLGMSSDSPQLERLRAAKAEEAELKVALMKEVLLDTTKTRSLFGRWGSILRRLGERLGKRCGNEATIMLNAALDECEELLKHELRDDQEPSNGDGFGSAEQPADGVQPGSAKSGGSGTADDGASA